MSLNRVFVRRQHCQELSEAEEARRRALERAAAATTVHHKQIPLHGVSDTSLAFSDTMSENEKEGWREAVKALRDLVTSLEEQLEEARGLSRAAGPWGV